jgi:hypothetical protein
LENLEFGSVLGRGYLCGKPAVSTLGFESLMSFLGRNIFLVFLQLVVDGLQHVLCDLGKLVSAFLWVLPCVFFPFADFALYTFAAVNHSICSHMLSYVNPPNESLNLEVVLGTPGIVPL